MSAIDQKIKDFFAPDPTLVLLLLHGSFAAERQSPTSDIDLAVLFLSPLSVDQLIAKAQALGHIMHREIDLVDLSTSHGALLQEALVRGRMLINNDPAVLAQLIRRMWNEHEDDARFAAKTIAERRRHWARSTNG